MIELLKDRYKLGVLMSVLFFVGIIASIYVIYSLPHTLMLPDGHQSAFADVYTVVGLTFLVGALTIWFALQHRNEVIVFRDKQLKNDGESIQTENTSQTTISLEAVKVSIKQSRNQKDILQAGLHAVCKQLDAGLGAVYITDESSETKKVELKAGYAFTISESKHLSYEFGEGLVGQSAAGAKTLYVDEVPDGYIKIISGLGSSSPRYLLIVPLKENDRVLGVIEIASFVPITEDQRKFVEESAQLIANSAALK